jgi:hypothetical protein
MNPLVSPGAGPMPSVPQHQPSNLFRYGEITMFSSYAFPASTALSTTGGNRLFAVAQGQIGQGFTTTLSQSETNLKEGGRVPNGQAFDIYGVATQVLGSNTTNLTIDLPFNDATATVQTLQNIVSNGTLRWDFSQTNIDICPIMLAGAGGGLYGAISQNAAATNAGAMNNGNGGIWMYRKHPVALPGSTTFGVVLFFGARTAVIPAGFGAVVRVVLLGYYKSVIEIG